MKLSWTIQWFDQQGNQTEIGTAVLLLDPGQEFAAGYARILNNDSYAILKIIQDHQDLEVKVGKQNFPVTCLNEEALTRLGEQEFKAGDVLLVYGPTQNEGAVVTIITLLPESIPATIKIPKD